MNSMSDLNGEQLKGEAGNILDGAAQQLEELLTELAGRLRPFPSFMGMVSVQAVELELPSGPVRDLGCVVVNPEGQICRLEIGEIAGIAGLTESEQVEEFQALELSPLEFIMYASVAIEVLAEELRRRDG